MVEGVVSGVSRLLGDPLPELVSAVGRDNGDGRGADRDDLQRHLGRSGGGHNVQANVEGVRGVVLGLGLGHFKSLGSLGQCRVNFVTVTTFPPSITVRIRATRSTCWAEKPA